MAALSRNGPAGVALLASIVLHVLLALWLARLMRPTAVDSDVGMQVVLHDALSVEPALPTPPPAAIKARISSASSSTHSPTNAAPERSAVNDIKGMVATPSLRLFNSDGSIRLPASDPDPGPFEHILTRGRELMNRGHNILHCRRGRFDFRLTPEVAAQESAKQTAGFHRMFDDPNQMQVVREGIAAADVMASHDTAIVARERIDRVCDDDQAPGHDGGTENRGKRSE